MIMVLGLVTIFLLSLTPTIVQIVFWGAVTIWTFTYTLLVSFTDTQDDDDGQWRASAAGLITLFWMINIVMWFASTVNWMLFSDLFFVVLSGLIFKQSKKPWAFHLACLYLVSFALDIVFWIGLPQHYYAFLANIVYSRQLFIVSGWKPMRRNKKEALVYTAK